ncbi:MAG TPA: sugar phosphate isomerase/epimerase family protein [bacterium]|nr:sugar phosphate isomerase/epimerase family protein [bacterium]
MKISLCTISLINHAENLEQVFQMMNKVGIKYADARASDPKGHVLRSMSSEERKNVVALARKYGISICSLAGSIGGKLSSEDEKVRDEELAEMKKEVDLAVDLEASVIRIGAGIPYNPDPELVYDPEMAERVLPYQKEAAKYAEKKGIKMGIENHGFYLSAYTDKLADFCRRVGSKNFGVIYEPGNLFGNLKDYRKGFYDQKDHIVHVHLKDGYPFRFPKSIEASLYCTVYGLGKLDIPWIIGRLRDIDYKGCISIEYEAWHPEYNLPEPEKGISECKIYLERVMEQV